MPNTPAAVGAGASRPWWRTAKSDAAQRALALALLSAVGGRWWPSIEEALLD
jgi:pyrroline-5-carboxylate reductase